MGQATKAVQKALAAKKSSQIANVLAQGKTTIRKAASIAKLKARKVKNQPNKAKNPSERCESRSEEVNYTE